MKLTCKDASRLISEGLDRKLGLAQRTALRLHLAVCDACTRVSARFSPSCGGPRRGTPVRRTTRANPPTIRPRSADEAPLERADARQIRYRPASWNP